MDYLRQSPRKSPRFGSDKIVTRSSPRRSEKDNSRVGGLKLRGSPRNTPKSSPRSSPRVSWRNMSGDVAPKSKKPDKAIKNLKFLESKQEEVETEDEFLDPRLEKNLKDEFTKEISKSDDKTMEEVVNMRDTELETGSDYLESDSVQSANVDSSSENEDLKSSLLEHGGRLTDVSEESSPENHSVEDRVEEDNENSYYEERNYLEQNYDELNYEKVDDKRDNHKEGSCVENTYKEDNYGDDYEDKNQSELSAEEENDKEGYEDENKETGTIVGNSNEVSEISVETTAHNEAHSEEQNAVLESVKRLESGGFEIDDINIMQDIDEDINEDNSEEVFLENTNDKGVSEDDMNKDIDEEKVQKTKPKKRSWRARYWKRGQQPQSLSKRLKKDARIDDTNHNTDDIKYNTNDNGSVNKGTSAAKAPKSRTKAAHLEYMRKRKLEKAQKKAAKSQNLRNRLTSMIDKLQTSQGFVDRVELSMKPEDLVPMRRTPRMASLNAIAKVNALVESSSPLAGKSIDEIKKTAHEKKVIASLHHKQMKRRKPSSSSLTQTDDIIDYPPISDLPMGEESGEWIVSSASSVEGYRVSPVDFDQPISDNHVSSTSSWLPDETLPFGIMKHDKAVQTVTNHKAVQTDSYLMEGVRGANAPKGLQSTTEKESGCTCVRPDAKPVKENVRSCGNLMPRNNPVPGGMVSNKTIYTRPPSSVNPVSGSNSPITVIPVNALPGQMVSNYGGQRYQIIHIPPTVQTNMVSVPIRSSVLTKTPTHTIAIPFTKNHVLAHSEINKIIEPPKQIINLHGSRKVLNLNSMAMSNAMIILGQPYSAFTQMRLQQQQQQPQIPRVHQLQQQYKPSKGRGTVTYNKRSNDPVNLRIPKINYQAASTSIFSSLAKQKGPNQVKAVQMKNLSTQMEKLLEEKKSGPRTPKV